MARLHHITGFLIGCFLMRMGRTAEPSNQNFSIASRIWRLPVGSNYSLDWQSVINFTWKANAIYERGCDDCKTFWNKNTSKFSWRCHFESCEALKYPKVKNYSKTLKGCCGNANRRTTTGAKSFRKKEKTSSGYKHNKYVSLGIYNLTFRMRQDTTSDVTITKYDKI